MVERSLCMREVQGSIPCISTFPIFLHQKFSSSLLLYAISQSRQFGFSLLIFFLLYYTFTPTTLYLRTKMAVPLFNLAPELSVSRLCFGSNSSFVFHHLSRLFYFSIKPINNPLIKNKNKKRCEIMIRQSLRNHDFRGAELVSPVVWAPRPSL